MPTITVSNLGQIGLVADKEPVTLPPNAWNAAQNIRFDDRSAVSFKGYAKVGEPTVHPETLTKVKTNRGQQFLVYAAGGAIYSYLISETNISGDTFQTYGTWDSCVLGGVALINNGVDNPQYWGGVGNTVDLPYDSTDPENVSIWKDCGMSARVIRPFRYHLFAMDVTDCSGINRRKVHWSHPAEPGTVPITWDPTKPEYDAGFVELSDTSGVILDGLTLRDTFQIYKEDAVYSATYTGRQDNQIFNFRLVTDSKGLYAKDCVCDIGGRHFLVSDGDIYIYDGTNFRSIADERVKNLFFGGVNKTVYKKTYCVYYHRTGEVWLCYPGLGSVDCNKALVWDSNSNVWSQRNIPNANCGIFGLLDSRTSGYTWADAAGITWSGWDAAPLIEGWFVWAYPLLDFALEDSLILAGSQALYEMDNGNTEDGVNAVRYLRRTHLDLGDKGDWHMVKRLLIWAEGDPFLVRVGKLDHINGTVEWSDYQTFDPNTDYKLDFRISGRLHAVEFSSISAGFWRISGYEVQFQPVGRR